MTKYITTEQEKQRNKNFIRQYLIPCIPQIFNAMLILQHDYSVVLHIISSLLFLYGGEKTGTKAKNTIDTLSIIIFPFYLIPVGFILFFIITFIAFLIAKLLGHA